MVAGNKKRLIYPLFFIFAGLAGLVIEISLVSEKTGLISFAKNNELMEISGTIEKVTPCAGKIFCFRLVRKPEKPPAAAASDTVFSPGPDGRFQIEVRSKSLLNLEIAGSEGISGPPGEATDEPEKKTGGIIRPGCRYQKKRCREAPCPPTLVCGDMADSYYLVSSGLFKHPSTLACFLRRDKNLCKRDGNSLNLEDYIGKTVTVKGILSTHSRIPFLLVQTIEP